MATSTPTSIDHGDIENKQPPAPARSSHSLDYDDQKKMLKRVQERLERKFQKIDRCQATRGKITKSVCTSNPAPVKLASGVKPENLLTEFRKAVKHSTPLYPTYLHGTIQKATE